MNGNFCNEKTTRAKKRCEETITTIRILNLLSGILNCSPKITQNAHSKHWILQEQRRSLSICCLEKIPVSKASSQKNVIWLDVAAHNACL